MAQYDVIVVGAGIIGCATAYTCAREKQKTLLLEQFTLPHTRGSSHGQTRVIRKAYTQEVYARMMNRSYELWYELEKISGKKLYERIPMLSYGEPTSPALNAVEDALKKCNCRYERLGAADLAARYPMLRLSAEHRGLLDQDAGVLRADLCLQAYQECFKKLDGIIRDSQAVVEINPGKIITVVTRTEAYTARTVILTCGPWTNDVLRKIEAPSSKDVSLQLPLQPNTVHILYYKEKTEGKCSRENGFPSWADYGNSKRAHYWGLPTYEYPGMIKVGYELGTPSDPDNRDKKIRDLWVMDKLNEYVTKRFIGIEEEPSIVETCMYTITPDSDYVLDKHPKCDNIIVGAGFSGHGFKTAPVIGEILTGMATDKKQEHKELDMFAIKRFLNTSKY